MALGINLIVFGKEYNIEQYAQKCLKRRCKGEHIFIFSDTQIALRALWTSFCESKLTWKVRSKLLASGTAYPDLGTYQDTGNMKLMRLSIGLQRQMWCPGSLNRTHSVVQIKATSKLIFKGRRLHKKPCSG